MTRIVAGFLPSRPRRDGKCRSDSLRTSRLQLVRLPVFGFSGPRTLGISSEEVKRLLREFPARWIGAAEASGADGQMRRFRNALIIGMLFGPIEDRAR